MKVRVITHTDLDGVGSGLLLQEVFGKENTVVSEVENKDITAVVVKFLEEEDYAQYDKVFMTDISVPLTDSDIVAKIDSLLGDRFVLLDHHATALWQNRYEWSNVVVEKDGKKTSGTSLVWDYVLDNGLVDNLDGDLRTNLEKFAEVVRLYDCWEWKEIGDTFPNDINKLFSVKGRQRFVETLQENRYDLTLSDEDVEKLEELKVKYQKYLHEKNDELLPYTLWHNGLSYKMGVVYADRDISVLGNDLAELNLQYDGIIIISLKYFKVSVRSVKDIDFSAIVRDLYGGGGHPKACGFGLTMEFVKSVEFEKLLQGKVSPTFKDDYRKLVNSFEEFPNQTKNVGVLFNKFTIYMRVTREAEVGKLATISHTIQGIRVNKWLSDGEISVYFTFNGVYIVFGGWKVLARVRKEEEDVKDFLTSIIKEGRYGLDEFSYEVVQSCLVEAYTTDELLIKNKGF